MDKKKPLTQTTLFEKVQILVCLSVIMLLFSSLYDLISYISLHNVIYSTHLITAWDDDIPFNSSLALIYLSTFLMSPLVYLYFLFIVKCSFSQIKTILFGWCIIIAVSLAIYFFIPTSSFLTLKNQVHFNYQPQSELSSLLTYLVFKIVVPGCSFPSTHISGVWYIYRCLCFFKIRFFYKLLYLIYCILVAISTVTLKLHLIADVIAALILVEIVYWFFVKPNLNKATTEKVNKTILLLLTAFSFLFLLTVNLGGCSTTHKTVTVENLLNPASGKEH